MWWRARRVLGLRETVPGKEKLSVVLLSYKGMKNLRHIVNSLLLCEFVHEILLSNNNPEVRMEDFIHVRDPRLRIINQREHCFPSSRYELARQLNARYFMSIDDDMFLSPGQVRKLFMALIGNPSFPHGAGGENFVVENGKVISRSHVRGEEREVDVILWAYAFTREHLTRYFNILDRLRIDKDDVKISEDVAISFSGNGRPRCENLGRMLRCPSSKDVNIAVYKQADFYQHRSRLYLKCLGAAAGSR